MSEDDKDELLVFQLVSTSVSAVSSSDRSLHGAVLVGQLCECFGVNFYILQVDQKSQYWVLLSF